MVILASIFLLLAFKGLDKAEENQIKIMKFQDTVSEQAATDNNVDLSNYHKVKDLFSSNNEEYIGLGSVYMDIAIESGKGHTKPSLYLNDKKNKGFIITQKSDGEKVVYEIVKTNNKNLKEMWKVKTKKSKKSMLIKFEDVE